MNFLFCSALLASVSKQHEKEERGKKRHTTKVNHRHWKGYAANANSREQQFHRDRTTLVWFTKQQRACFGSDTERVSLMVVIFVRKSFFSLRQPKHLWRAAHQPNKGGKLNIYATTTTAVNPSASATKLSPARPDQHKHQQLQLFCFFVGFSQSRRQERQKESYHQPQRPKPDLQLYPGA